MRKGHREITVTRHKEAKQSKATSSHFPTKIVAKLERIQSTAQQNMEQTQNRHSGSNNTILQLDEVYKDRPPDKCVYWKFIFIISHPKHMLWVLKRTVSMRQFF